MKTELFKIYENIQKKFVLKNMLSEKERILIDNFNNDKTAFCTTSACYIIDNDYLFINSKMNDKIKSLNNSYIHILDTFNKYNPKPTQPTDIIKTLDKMICKVFKSETGEYTYVDHKYLQYINIYDSDYHYGYTSYFLYVYYQDILLALICPVRVNEQLNI